MGWIGGVVMVGKMDDPAADKEKAEGERETVDAALEHAERGAREQSRQGISNRPITDEEGEQRELPPRGAAKAEE
jgi:hypothetical protein